MKRHCGRYMRLNGKSWLYRHRWAHFILGITRERFCAVCGKTCRESRRF